MSKLPKLEGRMDFDELMSGITKGDARVAAILAGAWLDELLCHAIKFNMIKLNAKEQDDLFEASGLLATFSSRIKTAYALGLISKKAKN